MENIFKNKLFVPRLIFIVILLFCSNKLKAEMRILLGEEIEVGIKFNAAIPCTSEPNLIHWPIATEIEWSELGSWGGGEWMFGPGEYYGIYLFDCDGYGTPSHKL